MKHSTVLTRCLTFLLATVMLSGMLALAEQNEAPATYDII